MPDIGTLAGTERVPIVRNPTDGSNYTTAVSNIAVFGGGLSFNLQAVDTRTAPQTRALPVGAAAMIPIVYDQYGNAEANNITITGAAFPVVIRANYGSIPFFWTGAAWFPF